MYKVLSLDGGGMRGLLSATLLVELEKRLGRPLNQVFDLITGTSTGAIEACLIACGYSANEIVSFYTGNDAKTIFKPYFLPIHKSKYSPDNIDSVLLSKFQDTKLKDLKTNVLIPAYDLIARNTLLFSNLDDNYSEFYLRDITRSSSAAPYFFTPHEFNNFRCIDGGISANNPSIVAYTYIKNKIPNADISIVSIGTGSFEHEIAFDDMCITHTIPFVSNVIDCFMDGNSDTVELEATNILKDKYFRFQVALPQELSAIDNISIGNLQGLQALSTACIDNQWKDQLGQVVTLLTENNNGNYTNRS